MEIEDMRELEKLQEFSMLESVSLNGTNVDDQGLCYLGRCQTVTNINLTFTPITDEGVRHLTALKHLRHLRLKDTDITSKSIRYFNEMMDLDSLLVHGTEIFGKEMEQLSLPNLKELVVDCDDAGDHRALLELSRQMPGCEIIAKGVGRFRQGRFYS